MGGDGGEQPVGAPQYGTLARPLGGPGGKSGFGHQPPLRVFLHCSRSTRAVLHTGHSIGATRSIRLNFGHAAVGAVLGTVGAGPWATVLLSPRPAVQPLHADLAGGG